MHGKEDWQLFVNFLENRDQLLQMFRVTLDPLGWMEPSAAFLKLGAMLEAAAKRWAANELRRLNHYTKAMKDWDLNRLLAAIVLAITQRETHTAHT